MIMAVQDRLAAMPGEGAAQTRPVGELAQARGSRLHAADDG